MQSKAYASFNRGNAAEECMLVLWLRIAQSMSYPENQIHPGCRSQHNIPLAEEEEEEEEADDNDDSEV